MQKWKPSPLRVKRESDGKIFSNSSAAAYSYKLQIAREIEACCDGFLGTIEGTSWSWIYTPKPVPDVGDLNDLKSNLRKELIRKGIFQNYYKKLGKAYSPNYREKCPRIAEFFRSIDKSLFTKTRILRMTELFEMYRKWCEDKNIKKDFADSIHLSKHLRAWETLYSRVCGLKLTYVILDGRKYWKRSALYFDPNLEVAGASVYDPIPEYSEGRVQFEVTVNPGGMHGYPVKCNGITYPSIKAASVATEARQHEIEYCCDGDVPFIKVEGKRLVFSYGKWEDVDPEWFIRKDIIVRDGNSIPVIDLDSGVVYSSIREASRETGARASKIKEFISNNNPEKSGIRVKVPFKTPKYYRFALLEE